MAKPKYFYGKTQKEVKQKMAAWTKEQGKGKPFEIAADAWDVWHTGQVSYNGAEAYKAALKRTKEHFQGRYVREIGPDEIDAYIRYIAGRGYARRTVQLHLDLLNMIYDYAVVNRWAETNPCRSVKVPSGLPRGQREIPTEDQLEQVRAGAHLPFGLFPIMLLYTGLRRGELLALRWEDIDRKNKVIHINKAVYFAGNTPRLKLPKSEAGRRDVVLLDALLEYLPEGQQGYLFGDDAPLTKSSIRKRWLSWCKAAGLATSEEVKRHRNDKNNRDYVTLKWTPDITPHQLRHAYATILFDAGIDEKDAQELLGHASIQVTRDIYTHIRQRRREKTAEKINTFLQEEETEKLCQNNVILSTSK